MLIVAARPNYSNFVTFFSSYAICHIFLNLNNLSRVDQSIKNLHRTLKNRLHQSYFNFSKIHKLFQNEVEKLRSMFFNNGYPNYFFDKVLYQFVNSRQINLNHTQPTNKKETLQLKFHMWGNSLTYSQKTLRNLFGNFLPCI